jgi:hypothetical protein
MTRYRWLPPATACPAYVVTAYSGAEVAGSGYLPLGVHPKLTGGACGSSSSVSRDAALFVPL